MPKNVVITPATGLIDFKDDSGNVDAYIQLDDFGNLQIFNPGGDISLGDTASDIYVGDGIIPVDIIFEQNGNIRAAVNKTLGIGQSNSFVTVYAPTTFLANVTAANVIVTSFSRLGTITSGTWNGSSISTTYTDAKVTSVNGQTGAATGFATTANSLSQFASTTSAQLATLISDETGSGALVLATTPTLVTPILGLATGTSVMLSANIGAAAGNVSGNFTAGNLQTAGNVNSASGLFTGSLTAGTLQTTGNVNASSLRVTTASSLGTVQSGTWNGSSISTTYTDAKVTSVNGQTGAATGFATTANSLSQFASTTSAQLATLISDETGSGVLVFGTSPAITTSLTTPSASFDLINTTATTVNLAGASTAITIGASTGTMTLRNPTIVSSTSTVTLFNTVATTMNFAGAATTLSLGAATGTTTINNSLVVSGNLTVNGTTTTINAVTITVDDKNIELGSVASPTDVTADGGGITLKGATDKTFNYVNATTAWTSSEDLNLLTGKSYEINGTSVLNATTLGSGVVNSSLTSVGTLGSLAVTNNVSAGAFLTTGSSTAGTFQTAGNVNANNLRVVTNSSLGTVVSGTWNGASISTTYTDAKVTSVNGQTGAATGFATTANTLAQFASTTSAQLATLISDETGSGALVFATTPTLVTPVLGLATGTSVMLSANIGAAAGNISGNFSVTGNVVASNVTVSNRVNFGNTASTVKVYQFYNGVAASFDTVFV